MSQSDPAPIVAALVPSIFRRAFGVGFLAVAGLLAFYLVLTDPPDGLQWRLVLCVVGALLIFAAYRLWNATGFRIELSNDGLRMSNGVILAKLEDIEKVDRSFFAFKPSNGFLVTLKSSHESKWVPGLWWRVGKRLGIGGLTSGTEGKIMADTLSTMLAERDGLIDPS